MYRNERIYATLTHLIASERFSKEDKIERVDDAYYSGRIDVNDRNALISLLDPVEGSADGE